MLPATEIFFFLLIHEVFHNEFQSFELVTNLILHPASKISTKILPVSTTGPSSHPRQTFLTVREQT